MNPELKARIAELQAEIRTFDLDGDALEKMHRRAKTLYNSAKTAHRHGELTAGGLREAEAQHFAIWGLRTQMNQQGAI